MAKGQSRIAGVVKKYEEDLLAEWIKDLKSARSGKEGRISEAELFAQAKEFINLLMAAAQSTDAGNLNSPE